MTKKIDRTGETYGAVKVIGPDPGIANAWEIEWTCCHKRQSISCERSAFLSKKPPKRCVLCDRKWRAANHRDRKDRTGDQYGTVHVIGMDPADPIRWLLRFDCCGTVRSMTAERCGHLERHPTQRCDACIRHKDGKVPIISSEIAVPDTEFIPQDDIYGLWTRAMDAVRRAAQ